MQAESHKNKALLFSLGESLCAVPLKYIIETAKIMPIIKIPRVPNCISGISSLRGEIIPIVDIMELFTGQKSNIEYKCLAVMKISGCVIGVPVNDVIKVISISENVIKRGEEAETGSFDKYVDAVIKEEEGIISLLDIEHILKDITEKEI